MSIGTKPIPPTDMTLTDFPVGSIRIDPLDPNYVVYKDIAEFYGFPLDQPLWFTMLDNEYGVQDNIQHQYDEVRPYMRSEPFRYYAGSQNEHIEFMVRFFATKSPSLDVHSCYEYLMALQYPWINVFGDKFKYPPPRLILSLNLSIIRTGYIAAMNVTWYNPVGYEGRFVREDELNFEDRPYQPLVSYFCEALMTFTAVGTHYNTTNFRGVPSANQKLENLYQILFGGR